MPSKKTVYLRKKEEPHSVINHRTKKLKRLMKALKVENESQVFLYLLDTAVIERREF